MAERDSAWLGGITRSRRRVIHMLMRMVRDDPRPGWWARRGVRQRSTLTSVLVVAVAFVIGAVGLVAILRITLTATVRDSVVLRAQDVAAQVSTDDVDAVSAMAGSVPGDATVVQVMTPTGEVLVASPSVTGEAAILDPGLVATAGTSIATVPLPFVDNEEYLVAALRTQATNGDVIVIAAQSLAPVNRVIDTVMIGLLIVGPFLLAAVGAVTWVAVGRSLMSVDRIRRRVEDIDASGLHERVPVPATKDEIESLALTMNSMLDRLEGAMTRQREFVGDASHELKTPLATMTTALDVARMTGASGPETIDLLGEEVARMTVLVQDLLTLARADDEQALARRVDVDLDDVVGDAVTRARPTAGDVIVRTDLTPVRLQGDPELLRSAARNLVVNAIRHARSQVVVRVDLDGSNARLVVADDGPGVPAADRERIFERFVRLDEHRSRDAGGTGLGLAIVREVTAAHGGRVWIEDAPEGGAQFVMSLPVTAGSPTASSR